MESTTTTELVVALARAATALVVLVLMCAIVCSAIVLTLEELGLRQWQNQHGLERWLSTLKPAEDEARSPKPDPMDTFGPKRLRQVLALSLHLPVRQLVGLLASSLQVESSAGRPDAFVRWFARSGDLGPLGREEGIRFNDEKGKLLPLHIERALDGLQSQLIRSQTLFRYGVAFAVTWPLFFALRLLVSPGAALVGQTFALAVLIPVFTFPFVPLFCTLLDRLVARD